MCACRYIPVCYGGNFAAARWRLEAVAGGAATWEALLRATGRSNHNVEQHFLERLWEPMVGNHSSMMRRLAYGASFSAARGKPPPLEGGWGEQGAVAASGPSSGQCCSVIHPGDSSDYAGMLKQCLMSPLVEFAGHECDVCMGGLARAASALGRGGFCATCSEACELGPEPGYSAMEGACGECRAAEPAADADGVGGSA